jgi:hypothetical protein
MDETPRASPPRTEDIRSSVRFPPPPRRAIQRLDVVPSPPKTREKTKRQRRSTAPPNQRQASDPPATTIAPILPHHSLCSDTVQLHGVPGGATARHLRAFFGGLDLDRIYLLQPDPARPHHAAVFAQFQSSTGAALALQRAGEVLRREEENTTTTTTVLSMTPVPAAVDLTGWAVPLEREATLDATLEAVVTDPLVPAVQWQVIREQWPGYDDDQEEEEVDDTEKEEVDDTERLHKKRTGPPRPLLLKLRTRQRLFNLLPHPAVTELRAPRQWLQDQRVRLLRRCPAAGFDDLYHHQAGLRLTQQCLQVLDAWQERVETVETMATRWPWLVSSSPLSVLATPTGPCEAEESH